MSDDVPGRVRRAFRDESAFEPTDDPGVYDAVETPFDGTVTATAGDDGRIRFSVRVTVPTLNEVTVQEVAEVVEDGWFETFDLRVGDAGDVTQGDHDLDPAVERDAGEVTVEASFSDINETRGVEDAAAVVNYVEGTYVQGVIPGYDYTEPVAGILAEARRAAGSE